MTFEEFGEFIGTQDGAPPKPLNPDAQPPSQIIGADVPRIDGPLKTTGTAMYAGDYNFPRMVYAVPVCSTIASGKIRSIDTSAAEKLPGVLKNSQAVQQPQPRFRFKNPSPAKLRQIPPGVAFLSVTAFMRCLFCHG